MAQASVLIVDDEPSVRMSLQPLLESDLVEVVTAATPQEAETLVRERAFSLVITDLRLSGRGGREGLALISLVRDITPGARVVLLTAYGTPEVFSEAMSRGAEGAWEKNIPMGELLRRVRGLGIPAGCDHGARKPEGGLL